MILTITPNPSLDSTLTLNEELAPGHVQRLAGAQTYPGGKGVNVSHACVRAGVPTLAVFPATSGDPFHQLMIAHEIPYHATSCEGAVRTNITITDPRGVTTKLNGPGPHVNHTHQEELVSSLCDAAATADYVVAAGSLPPGADPDFYLQLARVLHEAYPDLPLAIDTSDNPLRLIGTSDDLHRVNLLKPNGMELGQISGVNGEHIEQQAQQGDYLPCVRAAEELIRRGLDSCLTTLGSAGAVLTTRNGSWVAIPERITPVSTVGAGDCTLAGYLMGVTQGLSATGALRQAVAYGTAATLQPGTQIPSPQDAERISVELRAVSS